MRKIKAAQAERREYWRKLIALQEQSEQPVRVFCKEHRVGENSFYAWRHRLERQSPPESLAMGFALVEPAGLGHAGDSSKGDQRSPRKSITILR